MKIQVITPRLIGKLAALLLLGSTVASSAQIVFDDLDPVPLSTTRATGDSLNGLSPQIGSGTWNSDAVFGAVTGVTIDSAGDTPVGFINFTPPASGSFLVSEDVTPADSSYITAGFVEDKLDTNIFDATTGDVFVLLQPDGTWGLYSAGTTNYDGGGTASSFLGADVPNLLTLEYTPTGTDTGTADVFVNSVNVSGNISITIPSAIGAAGFVIYNNDDTTTASSVSNFTVAAAPEPSSVALVTAGTLALLVGLVRRRQKASSV
jgi:hypothetical protein